MPRGGARPGGGRPKGAQNKISRELKDMILDALSEKGGTAYLVEQAGANPVAFLTLIGKVLPIQQQHSGPDGKELRAPQSVSFIVQQLPNSDNQT